MLDDKDSDKVEAPVIPLEPKQRAEKRLVVVLPQAWSCPFCGIDNGLPEVKVCKCGAVRDGGTATK